MSKQENVPKLLELLVQTQDLKVAEADEATRRQREYAASKSAVQFGQMTIISRLLHEGPLDVGYQDPGSGNALLQQPWKYSTIESRLGRKATNCVPPFGEGS